MRKSKALGVLLLAFGAATAGDVPINPEYKATTLKAGQGMVMLRVINTAPAGPLQHVYDIVWFNNGANYASTNAGVAKNLGWPYTSVFVESLPPGTYFLEQLKGEVTIGAWGAGGRVLFTSSDLTFRVEPGRLTNLGTLLIIAPYSLEEDTRTRLSHVPDAQLPLRLASLLPSATRESLIKDPLGWTNLPATATFDLAALRSRRLSMAFNGPARASDGGLWFGEHLGQVAHRSPAGAWSWEDTGVFESILQVAESNGRLYALSENSTMQVREQPGQWRPIEVPVVGASPCGAFVEPDGSLMTLWETPQAIHVLSFRPGSEPQWTTDRVIDIGGMIIRYSAPRCVSRESEKTRVVYAIKPGTPGIKKPSMRTETFNKEKRSWSSQSTDLHVPANLMPDGTLHAMRGASRWTWFGVSQDNGRTWTKRGENYIAEDTGVFRGMNEGFQARVDLQESYRVRKSSLWFTADGGYTWKPQSAFNGAISRVIPLGGQEVLVATAEGRLFVSNDNGRTLRTERNAADQHW